MEFKFLVVVILGLVLASLGRALFHLSSKKSDSHALVRALSWRIGLSVLLFVLLIFAYHQGWIEPKH
jgi:hypothetical protein